MLLLGLLVIPSRSMEGKEVGDIFSIGCYKFTNTYMF